MYPIAQTKVVLPRRRTGLLSRQRLIKLFNDLIDHRLTVITAPAGYGKTTLLVDVAHQIELPVCWYAVDALDNDVYRFVAHFIAAIAHRFPEFGQRSAAVLEGIPLDTAGLDRLVTTVVNELCEHVHEHFTLILDDYHLVNNDETIKYFMDRFIQLADENCHLIISSRKLLNIDLILLTAKRQAIGFGYLELAFQPEELQALLLQNYNLTISTQTAQALVQKTEGWITGLLLSVQTDWKGKTDRLQLTHVSDSGELYRYLAQQVLAQQSPAVRDFLLRTSLLEEFDADLCQAVFGPGQSWSNLLETVANENLFVLRVDNKLRYHHLFQDFLQHQMQAEQPQERERILRQLGFIFIDRQQWEKAHQVYFHRLGDAQATAQLIEQAGQEMIGCGRLVILEKWIDALPAEILTSRARLLAIYGFVKTALGKIDEGLVHLNRAETLLQSDDDPAWLMQALVWRSTGHKFKGTYQQALADANAAMDVMGHSPQPQAIQAQILRARGAAYHHLGNLNEAIACWEQSLAVSVGLARLQDAAVIRLGLGIAYASVGYYSKATDHFLKSLEYWQQVGNLTRQANLLNNLAVIYHYTGDYESAREKLEQAVTLARQSGYTYVESIALASIGDLYVDLDDPDAALTAYEQAHQIARQMNHGFLLFYTCLARASVMRRQGDLAQAKSILKHVAELVQNSESAYEEGLYRLEQAGIALAEQKPREAIPHLEAVLSSIGHKQRYEYMRALLSLAGAHQLQNNAAAARQYLAQTFDVAASLENKHLLVTSARQANLVLKAFQADAELGPQVSQLQNLVFNFEQSVPTLRRRMRQQVQSVPITPPRLQIQAFGQSRVTFGGTVVASTKWQNSDLMREYFFYLLTHPNGIRRQDIGLVVGPDYSPTKLKRQFKNTVYRLRQMFTKDVIVFDPDEERYYFNRQQDYEYDVEAFEIELERARALKGEPEQQARAYQAAVALYNGEFLPELDGQWVLAQRERLSDKYVEALLKLSEFHLKNGVYEQAIYYSQRIAEENPYMERAYRLAMRAYAALGDRAAVKAKFEQCRQLLYDEVAAPVSPQTQGLYQTLVHS